MKEKTIDIKINNGKLFYSNVTDRDNGEYSNPDLGLKEIAIVIECLKKEQEKIMNKQKDEANKSRVGIGKQSYSAIVLPDNASLSLVIRFLNDMHIDIIRDDVKQFWDEYRETIHTIEI